MRKHSLPNIGVLMEEIQRENREREKARERERV